MTLKELHDYIEQLPADIQEVEICEYDAETGIHEHNIGLCISHAKAFFPGGETKSPDGDKYVFELGHLPPKELIHAWRKLNQKRVDDP